MRAFYQVYFDFGAVVQLFNFIKMDVIIYTTSNFLDRTKVSSYEHTIPEMLILIYFEEAFVSLRKS